MNQWCKMVTVGGDKMEIGKKIKQRRIELGWSQRDLAYKMGYTNNSTIVKIEQGKVDVSQARVLQFSKVLGVSIAYLMDWTNEPRASAINKQELSEGEKLMLELFNKVPEDKQALVIEMIRAALKTRE